MNRFCRIEQLLGRAALEKLKNARVAVFGLGAVGSYAVEALARRKIFYSNAVKAYQPNCGERKLS